jgi:hypothetical protein
MMMRPARDSDTSSRDDKLGLETQAARYFFFFFFFYSVQNKNDEGYEWQHLFRGRQLVFLPMTRI